MTATPPPPLERTLRAADLVAYAGATWDWQRMHYDAEFLAARGLDRPVVDGQMLGALMAAQAMGWAPAGSFVVALDIRYAAMAFAGDTVRVDASIDSSNDAGTDLDVTLAQRVTVGERVVATGTTTVRRPPAPGER